MNSHKAEKTRLQQADLDQQHSKAQETPEVVNLEAEGQPVAVVPPSRFVWAAPPALVPAPTTYQHHPYPYVYQAPAPWLMQQPLMQNFQTYFPHIGFQQFQQQPFVAPSSSQGPILPANDLRYTLSRR